MTNLFDQINKEVEEMNKEKEMNKNDAAELQAILPEVEHNADLIEAKPKKRGRPPKVDTDIFVEMWTTATENSSLKEVAASLALALQAVPSRRAICARLVMTCHNLCVVARCLSAIRWERPFIPRRLNRLINIHSG